MSEPTSMIIDAGEHTAEELLTWLSNGRRIVIRTDVLGSPAEATLRFDGETYYCDTPTTLHKHAERADMAVCLEKHGYTRKDE